MRILEIGEVSYFSQYAPDITDFYDVSQRSPEKKLTLSEVFALRKKLKAGEYDLVAYHITTKVSAPWHRNRNVFSVLGDLVSGTLFHFQRVAWHYFHYFCDSATPLVVIDTQDVPRLTKTESIWLDRCRFWFMRELPPNHMNLFLNMDRRSGDVINIQRNKKLRRNFEKLEPFSLGFWPETLPDLPKPSAAEKKYDVFYSGADHTSTVRQRGIQELKALQAAGVRVYIPETRLSREDFFEACSQAWLVWSPEGQGWDCYRHYESLVSHSVPLINLPTTERYAPFRDGEHCLYYRPESGGLTEAIQDALKHKEALQLISENGRAYVREHHRRSQLIRHVLNKAGLLERAAPHLLDKMSATVS